MNIIEIAEEEAKKADGEVISSLILDVGMMAGIEFYALDTAIEMAVKNTMLEKAKIKVNKIEARAKCTNCHKEFQITEITDPCPYCNSLFSEVISGKELKIRSLTIEQ